MCGVPSQTVRVCVRHCGDFVVCGKIPPPLTQTGGGGAGAYVEETLIGAYQTKVGSNWRSM